MDLSKSIISLVNRIFPAKEAYAHCDIPCGIYDPHLAQVAAHSVIRMVQLIEAVAPPSADASAGERARYVNFISRYVSVKEEHAELCKKEIRILWGDYFKDEHVQQYQDLHEQVFNVMKLGSAARQGVNLDAAQRLLAAVQRIAEIFWETKGVGAKKTPSNYPSGGDLVVPA